MPEGDTAELIASILVTLGGTLASAYLAKKLIDAMDMSKKVRLMKLVKGDPFDLNLLRHGQKRSSLFHPTIRTPTQNVSNKHSS